METEKLVGIWNEYCNNENMDEYIYSNDEYTLNEMFQSVDEALRAAFYGKYRYCDKYVIFNGYGNLVSFDNYEVNNHIDFDTLIDYITDIGCYEITEVWNEDIYAYFVDFFNEKYNLNINVDEDENFYNLVQDYNLITDDWDIIAEDIKEDLYNE